jgi:excisionase family DNA binding protein
VQPKTTAALFVRIPTEQANHLDRAAFELQVPKQRLVSDLLERYVDPDSPESLAQLRERQGGPAAHRRVRVEALDPSTVTVGHHSFRPREPEVLTAQEVAELLQVQVSTILDLSGAGELPGRKIGGDWRFARAAILQWLTGAPAQSTSAGESDSDR